MIDLIQRLWRGFYCYGHFFYIKFFECYVNQTLSRSFMTVTRVIKGSLQDASFSGGLNIGVEWLAHECSGAYFG